ncbi:ParB/RepB/Spo0J family partition protein [Vreelandella subglaciescola]|jgi:ParB family chromosome partitioning protein|uniref:Probable chromosome-partitioning protein ParB n=1 Tax=Vreelandella subglaciescola TaxID=29571 RepID=A0A1M7H7E0_9GAMM|nr:ParB/RepB/Spo0J family partition protein [Halomonas subglaciescola]SHM24524.1 chromosome partitioning protein, ParB family [Halomonas subglaciescola]
MTRKRALGRGLDALIGAGARHRDGLELTAEATSFALDDATAVPAGDAEATVERLERLPLGQLARGKYQPRRDFHPEALEELADSIRAQGVMQPIVVRAVGEQRYEIIAGERRFRAAQLAELDVIPAIIRDVGDDVALALSLIENIQRENLNAIEEALAFKRLSDEFSLTQQQIADTVGKSRTQVANLLRLLSLETDVQTLLERGDLDMGHARALLALEGQQQRRVAHDVVNQDLTVRATEALVKNVAAQTASPPRKPAAQANSSDVAGLETRLSEQLGAPVSIKQGKKGKGALTIRYTSLEELDGILGHIR